MTSMQTSQAQRLLQFGVALFLLGLVTGLAVSQTANPRMALASHIEAVMNGTFLIALGLLWPKLVLPPRQLAAAFWLVIYGTFANWAATLLAAVWAAGNEMMPQAARGRAGTQMQEMLINTLLITLAIAMITACVLILAGLRRQKTQN